jgi:hypothetical protein
MSDVISTAIYLLPTLLIVVVGYLVYRVYLLVRDARNAAPKDPALPP